MIVVMPHLQPVFFSARNGQPAAIEEFLGRELPEYIDSRCRTVADRRARAIGGISMGGYGATVLGLKRPDVYGVVGAISAALSTGNRPTDLSALVAAQTADTAAFFYIGCGLQDGVLPASRDLAAQLRGRQVRSSCAKSPAATTGACGIPRSARSSTCSPHSRPGIRSNPRNLHTAARRSPRSLNNSLGASVPQCVVIGEIRRRAPTRRWLD